MSLKVAHPLKQNERMWHHLQDMFCGMANCPKSSMPCDVCLYSPGAVERFKGIIEEMVRSHIDNATGEV